MARSCPRPCVRPGCRKLSVPGTSRCEQHAEEFVDERRAADRARGTRQERGYGAAWVRYTRAFLIEHPFCKQCQKEHRQTQATEVDHIVPHRGDEVLFWDETNHQALCHRCHSRKTAAEDGGFGNAPR